MNIRSDLGWEKYLKPFLYKRLPDGTGWSAVLGTMCALTFMLLVVTGMILAFYYVPPRIRHGIPYSISATKSPSAT